MEPLEKRVVKTINRGKEECVSVLNQRWIENVNFVLYHPPPDYNDAGLFEEWVERLVFINDDLQWLLRLPHEKFWCQLIFDESLQRCIESYLRYAPRSFDPSDNIPAAVREKHRNVHKRVFMVCLRMATYKESKDYYITPSVFGEIIYENFLFDIPKIFDICALYGRENSQLLKKMIENIFSQQTNYFSDLEASVPTILQIFTNIQVQCGITEGHVGSFSPTKINPNEIKEDKLVNKTNEEVKDLILYFLDSCQTLYSFLDIFGDGCNSFFEQNVHIQLAFFYANVPVILKKSIRQREYLSEREEKIQRKLLHKAKVLVLQIIRLLLTTCCIQPIADGSSSADLDQCVESYFHFWSTTIGEKQFIVDFTKKYPIDEDLSVLTQSSYPIDDTQVAYLLEAVGSQTIAQSNAKDKSQRKLEAATNHAADLSNGGIVNGSFEPEDDDYEEQGACAPRKSDVELNSLISSVRDVLDMLGDGFIESCLEELDYDVEKTINAVLEDNLPPSVTNLDRNMPRKPKPEKKSLLKERKNIFDNDEFDVFNRDDVNLSKIHIGKKDKLSGTLDDKSDMAAIKQKIQHLSIVQDVIYDDKKDPKFRNSVFGPPEDGIMGDKWMYEDEYDDTYDENNVGAADADSADELSKLRPFVTPRVLQSGDQDDGEDEEAGEENEENARPNGNADKNASGANQKGQKWESLGLRDPAVIREQAEQRRAARRGGRTYEVRGRGRGRGQEKDVERNRLLKDRNKGSRANHNRRALADRKKAKGMGPL